MSERNPYEHTLVEVNETLKGLQGITVMPGGGLRNLDGPTAIGVLAARSNLAVASALLAVADAIRAKVED